MSYRRLMFAIGVLAALACSSCQQPGGGECVNQVVLLDGGIYSHFANAQGCSTAVYRCADADAGTPMWVNACDCSVDGGLCQQNR